MEYALDKLDGSELGGRRWVDLYKNNQMMRTCSGSSCSRRAEVGDDLGLGRGQGRAVQGGAGTRDPGLKEKHWSSNQTLFFPKVPLQIEIKVQVKVSRSFQVSVRVQVELD